MMKVLAVMTYFQISLPTHNWDSAKAKGERVMSLAALRVPPNA